MLTAIHSTRILNVDDDPAKRYAVSRSLRHAGYTVVEAETGAEAIAMIGTDTDLAIVDVKLPDIHGFELCRRIKANPDTASLPVMHISATFTDPNARSSGLDSGADAYLTHPVDPRELVSTVRALLRLSDAERRAKEASDEWQATFDAISDGVCLLGRDGAVLRFNGALKRMLRIDHAATMSARELICERLGISSDECDTIVQGVSERQSFESTVDGRWYQIAVDPDPATGGSVCIVSDVTEFRRIQDELAKVYDRDHRIAEVLQRSLLLKPTANHYDGLQIETFYEAAWEEASVGGDFYDVFSLRDGRIAVVVSDAAGKGLDAAAKTAEVKFALRAFMSEHGDIGRAVSELNNFLCANHSSHEDDVIVAVAVALINPVDGTCEFTVAGAEPPLILCDDGTMEVVAQGALPVGVLAGEVYKSSRSALTPGSLLLMATDGITEARHGKEFLGYEGMVGLAQRHVTKDTLNSVGMAIVDGARDFAGGRFQDDVCLLLVQWAGLQSGPSHTTEKVEFV